MNKKNKLSPVHIIEKRVEAQRAGDFRSIYNSTHTTSAFRVNFLTIDDYLEYARTHLNGQIRIEKFSVDSVTEDDTSAFVTARAKYVANHEVSYVFEMHELQSEDAQWRLIASCRLPVTEKEFLQKSISSDMFSGHPWF